MLTACAGRPPKASVLEAAVGWRQADIVDVVATAPQEVVDTAVRTAPARDEVDMAHQPVQGTARPQAAEDMGHHREATLGE